MRSHPPDPDAERPRRGCKLIFLARLLLLLIVLTSCLTASLLAYGRYEDTRQRTAILGHGGARHLNPAERLFLQTYLSARAEQLRRPIGAGETPVRVVVTPGENANEIAANLAELGLMGDQELFLNYLRYFGYDSQLEAGTYVIEPQLTLPELAVRLTSAVGQEITLTFLEGWRLEEMVAYLIATRPGEIDPAEFRAIALRQRPFDLTAYEFLASLPDDATLEGFLFPDTYTVALNARASDVVRLMLANFGRRVTPELRQQFGVQGLSLREAVTLASIVEREAVVPDERPLMAGVFLNRLNQGMRLDADPTVQYAVGYHAATNSWWKAPLSQADLQLDSPYNTYRYAGLPPGPIANPGLAALRAVAEPVPTGFLFFVLDCQAGNGSHLFSMTYEEHLANVRRCR